MTGILSMTPDFSFPSALLLIALYLVATTAIGVEPEEHGTFAQEVDTEKDQRGFISPAEALGRVELPKGFRAELFAFEPLVRQPIAITTDARGRLWVAENYTYAEAATGFDSTLNDRIVILEDTDGDGAADKRTVFWDAASKLTSVEVGLGGVWALCPPNLLFLPDADGDDRPDCEPIVVLDGWDDDEVRHNISNGLRWGPDGWIYGRHGILKTSYVGKPGTPRQARTAMNCGVWRFNPVDKKFQVVASGTTNPWGMDWDVNGEMFIINTVIGHLWHVIPGAHFERMFGEDLQPNLYRLMPQSADHFHWDTQEKWSETQRAGLTKTTDEAGGGHAHSGLMIYSGDTWPEEYRGDVYTLNFHGRRINRDRLERRGASYVGLHERDLAKFGDPWFRGVDLLAGPDGGVYVADWSDTGECHESDGVHRNSGRVYKINYGNAKFEQVDLLKKSNDQLVQLQTEKNEWLVRHARQVLYGRTVAGQDMHAVRESLQNVLATDVDPVHRLRVLWCLQVTGGVDRRQLLELLDDPNEHLRVWALRLLGEGGQLADADVRKAMIHLAATDSSGLVLLTVASQLQQLPVAERWPVAEQLAQRKEFAADPFFPLMLWYGIEPVVPSLPDKAVTLIRTASIPLIREFAVRRLAANLESSPEPLGALAVELAKSRDVEIQGDILAGMSAALEGFQRAKPPAGWVDALRLIADSPEFAANRRQLANELLVVFGDGRATDEVAQRATSETATTEQRRNAIKSLVTSRADGIVPLLQQLLPNPDLAVDAIRGLASFNDDETPKLLVERYDGFNQAARDEVIGTLTSRPAYTPALLASVSTGKIKREDVHPFQLRQMWNFGDPEIRDQLTKLWPELQHVSEDKAAKIKEYRELLENSQAAADPSQGRLIFSKSCAVCHRLYGEGQSIGPELTGSQRGNVHYLLENIVDPNLQIAENYRVSIAILEDGRVLTGIVIAKDQSSLTLQTPTEQLRFPLSEIEELEESDVSIMPEQILDVLTPDQVRDLLTYLMSSQQAPLPSESR
jgi:putative membrane-bound dehydrogenase-like protein